MSAAVSEVAWRACLPRIQQCELERSEGLAEEIAGQLQAEPLLAELVLRRAYTSGDVLAALLRRPDLIALIKQQLAYGPVNSAAPNNVINGGFGGV